MRVSVGIPAFGLRPSLSSCLLLARQGSVGGALHGIHAVDDHDLQVRDRVVHRAGADGDAVAEGVVAPAGQDLLLVHAAGLVGQAHLHGDLVVGELALDDLVEPVVVVAEHVDHDGAPGAAQHRHQQAVDVVPGSEERSFVVGIAVQEAALAIR